MFRTWVFGHRGASAVAPENTLAAFDAAFKAGADGIELDVQLSADGVPVVIHDDWLSRTTGVPGTVANSTLAELKKLDAGSWFGRAFANERIPTLGEALDLSRHRGLVNVEIKSSSRKDPRRLVDATLRAIDTWTNRDAVIVSSFDPRVVHRVKKLAPSLRAGFLRSSRQRWPFGFLAWWSGADFLHVDPPLAEEAARMKGGMDRVLLWTVDHPTEQQRMASLGVRALITNSPAEGRAQLDALWTRRSGVLP